jgi:hypothetical protein
MDRYPSAHNSRRYGMATVIRSLDDLAPGEAVAPRQGGVVFPVAWVAVTSLSLLAFMAWLLVG